MTISNIKHCCRCITESLFISSTVMQAIDRMSAFQKKMLRRVLRPFLHKSIAMVRVETRTYNHLFRNAPFRRRQIARRFGVEDHPVYSASQKSSPPLELFAIFSLRLSIFPWNFADLLPVHIHTCLPILVDSS